MVDANWYGFVEMAPAAPALEAQGLGGRADGDVRVSMRVGGGPPDQSYRFSFAMEPDGSAHCEYGGSEAAPAGASPSSAIPPGEVAFKAEHLRELSARLASTASKAPMRPPAFPPDSLIGQLKIDTPAGSVQTYFMADPDQASTAGMPPPEEVQEFADSVFVACENAAGTPKLRP